MAEMTEQAIVIALTKKDIQNIREGEEIDVNGADMKVRHKNTAHETAGCIVLSDWSLERLEKGIVVQKETMIVNGVKKEIYVRLGEVSNSAGLETSRKEELISLGMTPREAEIHLS